LILRRCAREARRPARPFKFFGGNGDYMELSYHIEQKHPQYLKNVTIDC